MPLLLHQDLKAEELKGVYIYIYIYIMITDETIVFTKNERMERKNLRLILHHEVGFALNF